ncbi:MAG: class II aldolase/adducin family protein [Halanaeroarchaeum sp.]
MRPAVQGRLWSRTSSNPGGAHVYESGRRAVAAAVPELATLTPGRTGNVSAGNGTVLAITPTGVPYDEVQAADVPVVDLEGEQVFGKLAPSSEAPFHRAIYREFDAGGVVHVHSPWATTLAVLRRPVPPVHYMLALAGGQVPVADYETYGTPALADAIVSTLREHDRRACLLANHGLVAYGDDPADAIEVARAVESTARLYLQAASVGDPEILSDFETERVAKRFETYGQTGS